MKSHEIPAFFIFLGGWTSQDSSASGGNQRTQARRDSRDGRVGSDWCVLVGGFLLVYDGIYRLLQLVGGLVAIFYFPIYWVSNHPN